MRILENTLATGRPTVEQSRLLSDRILDVAKRQFLQRGYNGTTFESIAAEVHTSRGALYHRFPDKAALFSQVVKTETEQMCARSSLLVDPGGSIGESLSLQALQIVSVSMEPQYTALYKIIIRHSPRTKEIDEALMKVWIFFVAHIQRFFKDSELIHIKNFEISANMFLGLVFQPVHKAIVYGYPMPTSKELTDHIETSVLMFLGGVGGMELECAVMSGHRVIAVAQ